MGTNKLTSLKTINHDIEQVLNNKYINSNIPPLWDGKTAERNRTGLAELQQWSS